MCAAVDFFAFFDGSAPIAFAADAPVRDATAGTALPPQPVWCEFAVREVFPELASAEPPVEVELWVALERRDAVFGCKWTGCEEALLLRGDEPLVSFLPRSLSPDVNPVPLEVESRPCARVQGTRAAQSLFRLPSTSNPSD